MAVGALSALVSCDSGQDSGNGDTTAGQSNVAGGNAAGAASGGATSAAGAPNGSAGAPIGGGAGGGPAGAAGQGQAGSTSGAGAGGSGQGGSAGAHMGGATGMAGAATAGAGGAPGPLPLPKITGGTNGFATRYWDCCKPACGSSKVSCSGGTTTDGGGNGSACAGGNSYMCWNFEPFVDTANKYVSYAFAASHRNCGSCWELQFTGKAGCSASTSCPGTSASLAYNTLFVQVLNTGDIKDDQFDLLIPGGGVGQFDACSKQWGTSDLGAVYGGFFTGCNNSVSCTQAKCNQVFAGKPDLLAGCNWFLTWFGAGDNPQITFKQVTCPKQLSDKSGMSG